MGICIKEIFRYLFVKWDNTIIPIEYDGGEFLVLSHWGEHEWEFSDNFWTDWKNAVSYVSGQAVDFCILSDEPLEVPNEFKNSYCDAEKRKWNKSLINRALEAITNNTPFQIVDADDNVLIEKCAMFSKKDPVNLKIYSDINLDSTEIRASSNGIMKDSEATVFARFFIQKNEEDEKRRVK